MYTDVHIYLCIYVDLGAALNTDYICTIGWFDITFQSHKGAEYKTRMSKKNKYRGLML